MKNTCISLMLAAVLSTSVYSQSGTITNTLGAGGSFIIKDATNTFFVLDQSSGLLTLNRNMTLTSTSGSMPLGVIYKGSESFIHDYQGSNAFGGNTFVGIYSGNFTMNKTSLDPSSGEASWNSAFGMSTLTALTTGHRNSAFGEGALQQNTSGYQNSAFGQNALNYTTTGFNNSAFGNSALVGNTGSNNSAFGQYAGNNVTTGSNLTLLGYNAQPSAGNATNEMTLGNGIATLRCAATSITSTSDERDKKNIRELSLGIDFLMKLKPRQFNWDKREWYVNDTSDGSKMEKSSTAGFIAQELDTVQRNEQAEWLGLVLKTNPDKLEATYGNLLPVMVKAIQDLKRENDVLNDRLTRFEKLQASLVTEMAKLQNETNQAFSGTK